mmetsp:Transcript_10009/g.45761  ORF Transcript_10009/g.45761 Transcript_10009/m.45761 type:complete len:353 (+) Transcript_10009:2201-3259(+)
MRSFLAYTPTRLATLARVAGGSEVRNSSSTAPVLIESARDTRYASEVDISLGSASHSCVTVRPYCPRITNSSKPSAWNLATRTSMDSTPRPFAQSSGGPKASAQAAVLPDPLRPLTSRIRKGVSPFASRSSSGGYLTRSMMDQGRRWTHVTLVPSNGVARASDAFFTHSSTLTDVLSSLTSFPSDWRSGGAVVISSSESSMTIVGPSAGPPPARMTRVFVSRHNTQSAPKYPPTSGNDVKTTLRSVRFTTSDLARSLATPAAADDAASLDTVAPKSSKTVWCAWTLSASSDFVRSPPESDEKGLRSAGTAERPHDCSAATDASGLAPIPLTTALSGAHRRGSVGCGSTPNAW